MNWAIFEASLQKNTEYLPKVNIDSFHIQERVYQLYITDSLLSDFNTVDILQNIYIILHDFCCVDFEEVPFDKVAVIYKSPLKDATRYHKVYELPLAITKQQVKMYKNVTFSNISKAIVVLHQAYPNGDVLSTLNTSSDIIIAKEDKKI